MMKGTEWILPVLVIGGAFVIYKKLFPDAQKAAQEAGFSAGKATAEVIYNVTGKSWPDLLFGERDVATDIFRPVKQLTEAEARVKYPGAFR
jgi:hypothetical protein